MDPLKPMKRLYIDMDGVICNYKKAFDTALVENPNQPYPQSAWGFFSNLEPIDYAIESVKKLIGIYDVWFLSTPSVYNLNSYTEKAFWIRQHFGLEAQSKLILATDKSLLKGHYLVDDDLKDSQIKFEGQHLHFGSPDFNNWEVVTKFLIDESNRTPTSKVGLWWGC